MKFHIKEREFSTVIIILAVIVVIVLGVVQYRWSNQVSEATSIRLADSLQMSMINWHLDFFRVFSEVCVALRVDPESSTADDWDQYARRYVDWKKTTANPNLVSGLYILRFDEAPAAQVLRLTPSGQRFEPSDWPSNFRELREELQQSAPNPGADGSSASSGERMPPWRWTQMRNLQTAFIRAGPWRAGSSSRESLPSSAPLRIILPPPPAARIPRVAPRVGS